LTKSATLSGFVNRRPIARWCSALTRRDR
jgi:hypothetical protein